MVRLHEWMSPSLPCAIHIARSKLIIEVAIVQNANKVPFVYLRLVIEHRIETLEGLAASIQTLHVVDAFV